uniref:Uncharacterized protein n=1 Tax=Parascaris univalens TaxID=6257 RepID=A0A915BY07_PARUN
PENEQQIDLSQLFAEVTRTVNGIKTMISPGEAGTLADSPISNIISGNVCFKACGMEDIQFAARRASDMLITMKACMLVLTVIVVLCMISLTAATVWYILKQRPSQDGRSSPLGSLITDSSIFARKKPRVSQNVTKE